MLDIGFTERDIKLINNRSHNLYNFKKLYQYFEQSGINNQEFIQIVKTTPNILSTSIENIKNRVSLIQNIGFNKIDTFNIIKTYPYILELNEEKINNKIDSFNTLGFSNKEIINIISINPSLLSVDNSGLETSYNYFKELDYPEEEIWQTGHLIAQLIATRLRAFRSYDKHGYSGNFSSIRFQLSVQSCILPSQNISPFWSSSNSRCFAAWDARSAMKPAAMIRISRILFLGH